VANKTNLQVKPSVTLTEKSPAFSWALFFFEQRRGARSMKDNIFFELADCVGEALAKRWLAQRPRSGRPGKKPRSSTVLPAPPSVPEANAAMGVQPVASRAPSKPDGGT
jgi:hypothetical protein